MSLTCSIMPRILSFTEEKIIQCVGNRLYGTLECARHTICSFIKAMGKHVKLLYYRRPEERKAITVPTSIIDQLTKCSIYNVKPKYPCGYPNSESSALVPAKSLQLSSHILVSKAKILPNCKITWRHISAIFIGN